jgi:hypothetical protein
MAVETSVGRTGFRAVADDYLTIALKRVSWGAIIAGVVMAIVIQLMLNMLGIGIGLGVLDPAGSDNPELATFSIAAGIWWTLSGIIASFLGGLVAGRLSGRPDRGTAAWHGLTTWAATTLLVFYLLTSAIGSILGGAFSVIGNTISGLGQATVAAAPEVGQAISGMTNPLEDELQDLTGAAVNDPAAIRRMIAGQIRSIVTADEAAAGEARQRAAQLLTQAANIAPQDAEARVAELEQNYRLAIEGAETTARQSAEAAAAAASNAAIFGFIALALGAAAAFLGGRAGTPHEEIAV